MDSMTADEVVRSAQARPSVAKLRRPLSVRARLALLITLAVALIIGTQAVIEVRMYESAVEREVRENARLTALAVADDFELRRTPLDVEAISHTLREFAFSAPAIRTVSIVDTTSGHGEVIASTASKEREEALAAALAAANHGDTVTVDATPLIVIVAVPATRDGETIGAAVVTASMGSVSQLRTKGRQVILWFTPAVILILTLIIDWFARWLIHRPIAHIHDAMQQAGEGQFSARASIVRNDEIGEVAAGLNDMLERLQNLNDALQERVDAATAELRVRNQELVESYQRVFALREALGRAEQMAAVGQTAASVAHQVGTPLNLISGYVQMLQEERSMDPKAARRLAIVQEQIAKVASVVRTMLDNARRPDTRRMVEIGTLLARVADVAQPKLATSAIVLSLDVAASLPPIEANSEELELAILNLVNNSLDAMPAGGSLAITARLVDGCVRIGIVDSGRGIPPELLPRIFDPWVTTKPPGRGTGLGLSITRDVITRHGGTISARSEPGRTAFTIDLPASTAAATLTTSPHVQNPDC